MTEPTISGHRVVTPTQARIGVIGLALVTILVLVITLTPNPVDQGKSEIVARVLHALHGLGFPESFGYAKLEFTANIVMFVPIGYFVGVIFSGWKWWWAIAFPSLLSAVIEATQFMALPERVASAADVLANTAGGWLGLFFAVVTRAVLSRRSASRCSDRVVPPVESHATP